MSWLRRTISIPALVLLWALDLVALPVLLTIAAAHDLRRRRPWTSVRFQLAVALALGLHVVGLGLIVAGWIDGLLAGPERERRLDARSEVWLATTAWSAACRLYRMHVDVEDDGALAGVGPLLLFPRHTSLLDVLLPVVFVAGPHELLPHYVAKRELLWDPCIDLLGRRIATAFVRRGGREHETDLTQVSTLAAGLGTRDVLVLFPEGTRFSEAKRARILAELASRDVAAHERARRLRHVLPPHVAGPAAALEHAPAADVVLGAHTGLEGASHLRDLVAGSLLDATVRIRLWRIPAREIPTDAHARADWIWRCWERVDEWIEEDLRSRAGARARGRMDAGRVGALGLR